MTTHSVSRREFCAGSASALLAAAIGESRLLAAKPIESTPAAFRLRYIVASPMYGTAPLATVLAEVSRAGSDTIDIWPAPHADHREQMNRVGFEAVEGLLAENKVRLGVITRYDLGPSRIAEDAPVLERFGGKLLVCGAGKQDGDSIKDQVRTFVKSISEQAAKASDSGVAIGIENHARSLLHTPDSIRYFADFSRKLNLGLAMAPYHLPQEPDTIAALIDDLGDKLVFFQAWEHGRGCQEKLPKEQELMQLPGRGALDFEPILAALKRINYQGWTEIFMHPVPRGIPILETPQEVTAEINRARDYLKQCLSRVNDSV